jgi:hypothetical protein
MLWNLTFHLQRIVKTLEINTPYIKTMTQLTVCMLRDYV